MLVFASKVNNQTIGGGRIMLADEVVEEILTALRGRRLASNMIPEHMPLLRTLQFVTEYRQTVMKVFSQ